MAAISAPDRTKANMAILADTVANGSPSFPFHVCHRNGYFALDPAPIYDPTTEAVEIIFTAPHNWIERGTGGNFNDNYAYSVVIGAIEPQHILINSSGFRSYPNGYDQAAGDNGSAQVQDYQAGRTYKMLLTVVDKDTISMSVWPIEGGAPVVDNGYLTVTDQFLSGNPVITFGYPTKSQLSANASGTNDSWRPAEGMIIHSVSSEGTGPTDVTLTNATVLASKESGYAVGKLQTVHPSDLSGFNYTLVAGTGDTNNALFTITGDLLKKLAPTAGTQSIRVQTTDTFGKTFAKALTVTVA